MRAFLTAVFLCVGLAAQPSPAELGRALQRWQSSFAGSTITGERLYVTSGPVAGLPEAPPEDADGGDDTVAVAWQGDSFVAAAFLRDATGDWFLTHAQYHRGAAGLDLLPRWAWIRSVSALETMGEPCWPQRAFGVDTTRSLFEGLERGTVTQLTGDCVELTVPDEHGHWTLQLLETGDPDEPWRLVEFERFGNRMGRVTARTSLSDFERTTLGTYAKRMRLDGYSSPTDATRTFARIEVSAPSLDGRWFADLARGAHLLRHERRLLAHERGLVHLLDLIEAERTDRHRASETGAGWECASPLPPIDRATSWPDLDDVVDPADYPIDLEHDLEARLLLAALSMHGGATMERVRSVRAALDAASSEDLMGTSALEALGLQPWIASTLSTTEPLLAFSEASGSVEVFWPSSDEGPWWARWSVPELAGGRFRSEVGELPRRSRGARLFARAEPPDPEPVAESPIQTPLEPPRPTPPAGPSSDVATSPEFTTPAAWWLGGCAALAALVILTSLARARKPTGRATVFTLVALMLLAISGAWWMTPQTPEAPPSTFARSAEPTLRTAPEPAPPSRIPLVAAPAEDPQNDSTTPLGKSLLIRVHREGRPLPDHRALVCPIRLANQSSDWRRTDSAGELTIDCTGWDDCWIQVAGAALVQRTDLPPGRSEVDIEVDAPIWQGSLRVVDREGQPCADAEVQAGASAWGFDQMAAVGRTDAQGELRGVELFQQHCVVAWHETKGRSVPVQLDPDLEQAVLRLHGENRRVTGRVVAPDGTPIPHAHVAIGYGSPHRSTRFAAPCMRETTTDADGRFVLAGCEAKEVPLWVRAPGFALHHELLAAGILDLSVVLLEGCTVRVHAPAGDNASITTVRPFSGPGWAETWSEREAGTIAFHNLAAAKYVLVWGGRSQPRQRRDLVIDENDRELDVSFHTDGSPLQGRVVDQRGAPMEGLRVACSLDGHSVCAATTDSQGAFHFDAVPDEAQVEVLSRGRRWSCVLSRAPVHASTASEVTLHMRVDTSRATLAIPTDLPPDCRSVVFQRADGVVIHWAPHAKVESRAASLEGVPAGYYTVTASDETGEHVLGPVTAR